MNLYFPPNHSILIIHIQQFSTISNPIMVQNLFFYILREMEQLSFYTLKAHYLRKNLITYFIWEPINTKDLIFNLFSKCCILTKKNVFMIHHCRELLSCMYLLPAIIEFLSYGLDYEEALLIRFSTIFKNLEHQQI